ncbi:hypothetical protein D8B26_006634 [Coccidioides posadasii str. Silveira]|uniref:uncharacterized protein n=1 Tax=Coccidioides posadasii (strain RMSCC 757 / Silveira) TaxID=443226 RepID=UPI001BEF1207|nr:hypothetical protein D8B26_006634 [Coccidioides posadasii str. Silveira]
MAPRETDHFTEDYFIYITDSSSDECAPEDEGISSASSGYEPTDDGNIHVKPAKLELEREVSFYSPSCFVCEVQDGMNDDLETDILKIATIEPPGSNRDKEFKSQSTADSPKVYHRTPTGDNDTGINQPSSRAVSLSPHFDAQFFFDLASSISQSFPYQQFAEQHGCTVDDVNDVLVANVVIPLISMAPQEQPKAIGAGPSTTPAMGETSDQSSSKREDDANNNSAKPTKPTDLEQEIESGENVENGQTQTENRTDDGKDRSTPASAAENCEKPTQPAEPATPSPSRLRKRAHEEDEESTDWPETNQTNRFTAQSALLDSPSPQKKLKCFFPEQSAPKISLNRPKKCMPSKPVILSDLDPLLIYELTGEAPPPACKPGRRRVYRDFAGSYQDVVPQEGPAITGYAGIFGKMLESGEIQAVAEPNRRRKFIFTKDMQSQEGRDEGEMDSNEKESCPQDLFEGEDEESSVPDEFWY